MLKKYEQSDAEMLWKSGLPERVEIASPIKVTVLIIKNSELSMNAATSCVGVGIEEVVVVSKICG